MFETFLIEPIFNLLVGIYAVIPGHNFGVAIIIFTIIVRLAMWPLIRKQLHHAKAMRLLQPELKRIKKESKGDKQKEAAATMALYKEREINPFSSIGYLIIQLPIFIGLYQVVNRLANDSSTLFTSSYSFIVDLPWMQSIANGATQFDATFLGFIDLTSKAITDSGVYVPGMLVVLASAAIQYVSSKQLMATQGEKRSLRAILKDQSSGKKVDQSEVSEAIGRFTLYFIPGLVFFISLGLVGALPFYWLINGVIAYYQQRKVLSTDVEEMTASVDGEAVAAEITMPKKMNAKQKREAQRNAGTSNSLNRKKKVNAKTKKESKKAKKGGK